ncbi:hypothetical protein [Mycolicibacterium peregrinum]|uniref:hypothetical protein n=1 Tax=Mycolicibacterium peregrinum TaxID=43304 RepID=UPI003AADF664
MAVQDWSKVCRGKELVGSATKGTPVARLWVVRLVEVCRVVGVGFRVGLVVPRRCRVLGS